MKPVTRIIPISLLCALTVALFACGGGGGTERTVTGIPVPTDIRGDLTPAVGETVGPALAGVLTDLNPDLNQHYYSFTPTAGALYSLEVFGARANQADWDTADNIPRLQIFKPAGGGTMDLYLEHDYSSSFGLQWFWGKHDLDMPLFQTPGGGTWYVLVSTDNPAIIGSDYIVRLTQKGIAADYTDDAVVNHALFPDNTTTADALPINPGDLVYDNYAAKTSNFYTFTISTTPAVACFEVTGYRNGRFLGDDEYFDLTLQLWDNAGQLGTPIVRDLVGFAIDDYYFSDPSFCYKLDPGTYWLEATDTIATIGSGNYFLSYTANSTFTAETENNDDFSTADPISYGDTVTGNVGTAGDGADWYQFQGTPGDLVQIRLFDNTNAADATAGVRVEFRTTGGAAYTLPASAPETNDLPAGSSDQYAATGPGAFTVRAILDAANLATGNLTTTHTYYLRITPKTVGTNYSFKLETLKQASPGAVDSASTLELDDSANTSFGPTFAEKLDANGYGAGNMDTNNDIDHYQFTATPGSLVTVNVYAKEAVGNGSNVDDKVHDLSGFGSTLEPLLIAYDTLHAEIGRASYNATSVTAESVTTPIPTLSLSFIATQDAAIPYFISIESAVSNPAITATYFIEVIKQ